MNKQLTGLIVLVIAASISACSSTGTIEPAEKSISVKVIKPAEAKEMLAGENAPVLIDVREPDEFKGGHISGSINIPLSGVVEGVNALGLDKDSPFMVYCRSGRRSAEAAAALLAAGYTDIYDLGGIIDWPYDTVN